MEAPLVQKLWVVGDCRGYCTEKNSGDKRRSSAHRSGSLFVDRVGSVRRQGGVRCGERCGNCGPAGTICQQKSLLRTGGFLRNAQGWRELTSVAVAGPGSGPACWGYFQQAAPGCSSAG